MPEEPSETVVAFAKARQRHSISAEVFGKHNKPKKFTPPVHNKTAEQERQIRESLNHCFLFRAVASSDLDVLIKAFAVEEAKAGDVIINQGDEGKKLYLVHIGSADCWKRQDTNDKGIHLCVRGPGECFGELALLYNAPRAASVVAKTDMELWTLDRETFNRIVKAGVVERRERYDNLLRNVGLFSKLDPYDRCRLADALQDEEVDDAVDIVVEGQQGDCMYMLLEGKAQALCQGKLVKSYTKGDYFGEIALLEQKPRATTVRSVGKCKLVKLFRESCIDLLGPMSQVLEKNKREYKKILEQCNIDKVI